MSEHIIGYVKNRELIKIVLYSISIVFGLLALVMVLLT